jgi:kynurenine formamidase
MNVHGNAASHIDALCHVIFDGQLYNGLQFEDLIPLCEIVGRWAFLCVIAPLRLPGGTGSPVNPIAIL